MKLKRIENVSDHDVTIVHTDGVKQVLESGHVTVNVNVINLNEIKHDTRVTYDLSEVMSNE